MCPELPTGTVTFLFTDIEGSTRLLHALGPDAYAEALAEHRRVLREAFAAHGGVEVDTQGDAFFVAFPTAPGAAAAALEALAALEPGADPRPHGPPYGDADRDRGGLRRRGRAPGRPRRGTRPRRPGAPHGGDVGAPRRARDARGSRTSPAQGLRRPGTPAAARRPGLPAAPDPGHGEPADARDAVPRSRAGAPRRCDGRARAGSPDPHRPRPRRHREDALRARARASPGGGRRGRHAVRPPRDAARPCPRPPRGRGGAGRREPRAGRASPHVSARSAPMSCSTTSSSSFPRRPRSCQLSSTPRPRSACW